MFTDLTISRGDDSYNKLMQDLEKPDLLILDDFGMKKLELSLVQDLTGVIEERNHSNKSIAISAQLPVKEWPAVFVDATIADAILDRHVHNAYPVDLKGTIKICLDVTGTVHVSYRMVEPN